MNDADTSLTRRTIVRSGVAGVASVLAPSFVEVASGATDSGSVEVETAATIPTDTSASITVYEDMDGDGTAERQQTESVPDGTNTLVYDALQGTEAQGIEYWLEVNLSTSDNSVTPSIDSATLTLPAADQTTAPPEGTPVETDKKNPGEIWESFLVFVGFITLFFAGLAGLASRSMAVGATAAYVAFGYLAISTGHTLLTNILYVSLVVVIIGMALKMWRMEFGGEI